LKLYNKKGSQEKEELQYFDYTALAKRIWRLKQIENDIENQFGNHGENGSFT
jgi:hypothetical protein